MIPKISVVIPVYNPGIFFSDCIESLERQTLKPFMIVLVDDGSTDGSAEQCDVFERLYDNVKVVHTSNHGVSHARNVGMSYIEDADYISFVDSDDVAHPQYIELLYEAIQNDNACASWCRFSEADSFLAYSYQKSSPRRVSSSSLCESVFKKNDIFYLWDKLFSVKIIKENHIRFDERYGLWEDLLFCFKYFMLCNDYINCVDEELYYYRQNGNSIVHRDANAKDRIAQFSIASDILFLSIKKMNIRCIFTSLLQQMKCLIWLTKTILKCAIKKIIVKR